MSLAMLEIEGPMETASVLTTESFEAPNLRERDEVRPAIEGIQTLHIKK